MSETETRAGDLAPDDVVFTSVVHQCCEEAQRLRGVVEAVQALVDEWEVYDGDAPSLIDAAFITCADALRAALAPVSSSGEAESGEALNVGVLADFVEVGRPGGEGEWVCGTCGYGPAEHGMTGHPSVTCVYRPVWRPVAPAPVPSGGQADGEGVQRTSVAGYLRATAAWCESRRTSPTTADLRAIAGMVDSGQLVAARPAGGEQA